MAIVKRIDPKYQRIERDFVKHVSEKTAIHIREEQEKTVQEWNLFDSGDLEKSLKGHFSVGDAGKTGGYLSMRYLAYTRFLDLADKRRKTKRDGYHLYNRIVFGILYRKTFPELQYGFTDQVKNIFLNKLNEAVNG